jgi:hypothetical protein
MAQWLRESRAMTLRICGHCRGPIRPGEARWAGREPEEAWHYDCAEEAGMVAEAAEIWKPKRRPRDGETSEQAETER